MANKHKDWTASFTIREMQSKTEFSFVLPVRLAEMKH